jgi:inhibitor of the pro-sigma K processing machinery
LNGVWLVVLVICAAALLIVVLRTKPDIRWFGYALLQVVAAALILFVINGTGLFGHFYIPINLVTVLVVAILGLPGLALLAVMKLTLL